MAKSPLNRSDPKRRADGKFGKGNKANPAGRPKGAKSSKSTEREGFREEMAPLVFDIFRKMALGTHVLDGAYLGSPEALQALVDAGMIITQEQKEVAFELRKAVLPDLRPIDADTGSSDHVVTVRVQQDADALAKTLEAVKRD